MSAVPAQAANLNWWRKVAANPLHPLHGEAREMMVALDALLARVAEAERERDLFAAAMDREVKDAQRWQAEAERLRAALRDIMAYVPEHGATIRAGYGKAAESARAALRGGDTG